MYQELQRLKVGIQSKKPYPRSVAEQLKALDLLDLTVCGMLLEDGGLTRTDISGMIDGTKNVVVGVFSSRASTSP